MTNTTPHPKRRRQLLGALSTGVAVAMSGCSTVSSRSGASESDGDSTEGTETEPDVDYQSAGQTDADHQSVEQTDTDGQSTEQADGCGCPD